jgi:hypothetical protein
MTTPTTTTPKTKESSVMDFTFLSLSELEDEVTRTFPNEECAECVFHLDLLSALPFRLMTHGWKKEEVLEFFTERVDEAADLLKEIEEEEAA